MTDKMRYLSIDRETPKGVRTTNNVTITANSHPIYAQIVGDVKRVAGAVETYKAQPPVQIQSGNDNIYAGIFGDRIR